MIVLTVLLVVLGGVLFVLKRAKRGSIARLPPPPLQTHSKGTWGEGLKRAIQQFSGTSSAGAPSFEVVSSHSLGPKKSIAVVKVAGQTLVLGVSDDSINLITQLQNQDAGDADLLNDPEIIGDPKASSFDANLETAERPSAQPTRAIDPKRVAHSVIRSQIRQRLEGLKPL